MPSVDAVLKFGFSGPMRIEPVTDNDAINLAARAQADIYAISDVDGRRAHSGLLATFPIQLGPIRSDASLSEEGKAKELGKVYNGAINDLLRTKGAVMPGLIDTVGQAEKEAAAATDLMAGSDAVREREVREFVLKEFSGAEALRRSVALDRAIEAGDKLTVAAFLNAPSVMQILGPDTQKQLPAYREKWLAKVNPALSARLANRRAALDAFQATLDVAGEAIRSMAGMPEPTMRDRLQQQ